MSPAISKDLITKHMSQSDLIGKIIGNSILGLASAILLVLAYIKFMELIGAYGFVLPTFQIGLFVAISLCAYYHYFWKVTYKKEDYSSFRTHKSIEIPFTWQDFFYTDKIVDNNFALIISWIIGGLIYGGLVITYLICKYCADNSESDVTMSLVRIGIIGIVSTVFYIYTQRYELRKVFWGTLGWCVIYGFGLSISMYLLGMTIGFSNMLLGVPLTIAILVLQLGFTSIYTYTDLVEWSKATHTRLISDSESAKRESEKKQKEEDAAKEYEKEIRRRL